MSFALPAPLPTCGGALQLATSGTITLFGSSASPTFGSFALTGNDLVMSRSNAMTADGNFVQASANVALVLSS